MVFTQCFSELIHICIFHCDQCIFYRKWFPYFTEITMLFTILFFHFLLLKVLYIMIFYCASPYNCLTAKAIKSIKKLLCIKIFMPLNNVYVVNHIYMTIRIFKRLWFHDTSVMMIKLVIHFYNLYSMLLLSRNAICNTELP